MSASRLSNQPIYYGRDAYEGFAKAFGNRLGVTVRVVDGANPCVNDLGEIQLPGMDGYQTEKEFHGTLATVIHEVSHVWTGTHKAFKATIKGLQETRYTAGKGHKVSKELFRDVLNAVMDVADETGIERFEINTRGNERPQELLVNNNVDIYNKRRKEFLDPAKTPPHLAILCAGGRIARKRSAEAGILFFPSAVARSLTVTVNFASA